MRHQEQRNSFTNYIPTLRIESVVETPSGSPNPRQDTSPSPSTSSSSHHLCSTFFQMCCGLLVGSIAACTMALSLATDSWLFTREPYTFTQEEIDQFNITDYPQVEVRLRSGLWRVCTTGMSGSDLCMPIDYTQMGSGRLAGAPTCMAVVGAIRYSTPAFVTALLSVAMATVLLFVGVVQKTVKILIASFLYVFTGLCLAVAIIIYISAINDEVGYSTRKSSAIDFHYHYGWSFLTACLSFLASEGAAVLGTLQYVRTKGDRHIGKETDDDVADILPAAPLSRDALRIWSSFEGDNSTYGHS